MTRHQGSGPIRLPTDLRRHWHQYEPGHHSQLHCHPESLSHHRLWYEIKSRNQIHPTNDSPSHWLHASNQSTSTYWLRIGSTTNTTGLLVPCTRTGHGHHHLPTSVCFDPTSQWSTSHPPSLFEHSTPNCSCGSKQYIDT